MAMSNLHTLIHPIKAAINQKQVMIARTRLNVTTCLYLCPSNSARSLSTLIAVDVKQDNPHKHRECGQKHARSSLLYQTEGRSHTLVEQKDQCKDQ